jgi:drug/metabolite transporter (DMT)-like permease
LALLACLGAALSYALASVRGRRFRAAGLPPLAMAFGQLTASSVLLLPIWLAVDRPWALGWLVLGERLEPRQLVGLGLILAGLAVIDGRLFRRR